MKLAEALIERASLVTKYQELKERIARNAVVQEGERPAEDPQALLDEARDALMHLSILVNNINVTNTSTTIIFESTTGTMTAALANRDMLRMYHNLLRETVASVTGDSELFFRRTRAEIKQLPALDVAAVQKNADTIAKRLRDLEVVIQQANWQTEVVEDG